MRKSRSLDAEYFDALYDADSDPWRFATSRYEAAKYRRTLAALGDEPVRCALEVGCSIGVFTDMLAARCDKVVATDLARAALEQARRRSRGRTNIEFRLARSIRDGFEGAFDLIVLCEVVYYWDDRDLAAIAERVRRALLPGGRILLAHWLGETDYPKSADEAVSALARELGPSLRPELAKRFARYRLDLWRGD